MGMIGRRFATGAMVAAALGLCAEARAESANFSGPWAVSGQIFLGNMVTIASPICTFRQLNNRLAGICRGPNGTGAASGLSDGLEISWQWRIVPTTPIGVAGVASFNGHLGPDNVIRGSWTISPWPGVSGQFTAQRP